MRNPNNFDTFEEAKARAVEIMNEPDCKAAGFECAVLHLDDGTFEVAAVAPDPGYVKRLEEAGAIENAKHEKRPGGTITSFEWPEKEGD